jgi:hypothetical protein
MRYLALLCGFAAIIVAVACGDGNSPSAPSAGTGTLNVRLTDSPFSDAKAVLVTFSSVRAHRSDSEWTTVPFAEVTTSRTCDLKKLQGPSDLLGTGPLPAGRYEQVRLVVQSAALYFDNPSAGPPCAASVPTPAGASAPLEIPSGEVKLNRGFELKEGAAMNMLLDFDGDKSIHQTGNGRYMMSPVIAVVSVD